jgi:hypothetical protein
MILKKLHVDFDNIEGVWDDRCFYTRVGSYIEYVFSTIKQSKAVTLIHFNKKVSLFLIYNILLKFVG